MIDRKLIIIFLFLCQSLIVLSQSEIGASVSYKYYSAPEWDNTIRTYNFMRPWLSERQPLMTNGFSVGLFYSVPLHPAIHVSPELNYSLLTSTAENNEEVYKIGVRFFAIDLNGRIYAGRLGKSQPQGFLKNLYLEITPSLALVMPVIKSDGEAYEVEEDEKYKPVSFAFNIGVGAGYDISLAERIKLSPYIKFRWFPNAEIEDFASTINGSAIPDLSDESPIYILNAGAKISYVMGKLK